MILQDAKLRNDKLVAYGFLSETGNEAQMMQNKYIQLFYTASDTRKALACASSEVQVVVCEPRDDELSSAARISPLNLAAALHKDNPFRDIYIERADPESLFISRAETAGARGVITDGEAKHLLGLAVGLLSPSIPTSPTSPASPSLDLAWLEEALELEELDDIVNSASSALLEKPPSYHSNPQPRHEIPSAQHQANEQSSSGNGVVAAFVSGRGGVGKSSLTVLSAFDLWDAGFKVVMLDMDLQFGDISILAGQEPESRIQRLGIEQLCENKINLPSLEDSLLLIEAPQHPETAEELIHRIPHLLAALKAAADIVLINTSCLWNEAAAVLASNADKLVICMDQRATSISAARQVVDLCIRLQIPSTQLHYLLNRCTRSAPITDIDASLAMGGVDVITIAEGGADVDELLSLGCPMELLSAQSLLKQSIHKLGTQLLADPCAGVGLLGSHR